MKVLEILKGRVVFESGRIFRWENPNRRISCSSSPKLYITEQLEVGRIFINEMEG